MKKLALVSSVAVVCSFLSMTVSADYAPINIDVEEVINLEYGQTIDMTGSVNVPTVDMGNVNADVSVNQFNHESPVTASAIVSGNMGGADGGITDLNVDVTAVGNNASIDVNTDTVIGAVQGNQAGGVSANGAIIGNRINLDSDEAIVELNVTAVGNNLTIADAEGDDIGQTSLGSVQFNYESPVSAVGSISNNGFGVNPVGRDPILNVTAVGNNLTAPLGATGSMFQENRGSLISARGFVVGNTGAIGPVTVNVSAVGNNISIKAPSASGDE
ncbi:MAG: hypothetical protein KAH03_02770 [Cocleimonas sp.]|nr:hypothetical protein [Cocleimonas sp.]